MREHARHNLHQIAWRAIPATAPARSTTSWPTMSAISSTMSGRFANDSPVTAHEGRTTAGGKGTVTKHVNQDLLVRHDPARFFVLPYVGPSGWVGVRLDGKPDWEVVADLLRDGYRLIAPKKLLARLETE